MVWAQSKAPRCHLQQLPRRKWGMDTAPEGTAGTIFKACWSKNSVVSWLQEWNGSPQRHEGTKKS